MKVIHTENFEQTQLAGREFASEVLALKPGERAVVLALRGDLGAGKTTFLQGFAKGLGVDQIVNSPTFVIMKRFPLPSSLRGRSRGNPGFENFYHFDCYRLENPDDILHLGFKEIISDPKNIVAIEWPEKIASLLPKDAILINFEHDQEHARIITWRKKSD